MPHPSRLPLLMAFFIALALSSSAVHAESDLTDQFSGWSAWAARTANGTFALDSCKTLVVGKANRGHPVDLICPYDYGSASTATFVQSTTAVYSSYMPITAK